MNATHRDPASSRMDAMHRAAPPKKRAASGPLALLRELGLVLVIALVISTLLRAFVVQVFWIPSPSMNDTLKVDDKIAVSRIDGLRGTIERGDVVVFHDSLGWISTPAQSRTALQTIGEFVGLVPSGGEQTLVKRVIGIGGDRVSCGDDGVLKVNGVAIDEPYLAPGQVPSAFPFDVVVPEGTLWVMGDNRGNSADSRYHQGEGQSPFVPVSSVVGTVQAVIWPISNWKWGLSEPGPFAGASR